ncbi:hypothetical protein T484DRAFT_1935077 [Baffinella frigidus]|nr:hypothetical protein T484DRAFT_1935077 [Cryptophyta sp. CCMP2293]
MAVPCAVHRQDANYVPARLLAELISRAEGPLWERIRGRGLAYHASLDLAMWSGQLCFCLGDSADPAKALAEFLLILKEVPASLDAPDAPAVMAEAKASLLFSLHSKRATAGAALNQAASGHFLGAGSPELELAREAAALDACCLDDVKAAARSRGLGAVLGTQPEVLSLKQVLISSAK